MIWRRIALALLVASLASASLHAQDAVPRVDVHGFGSWAYGRTNGNVYLSGDERGRYDDASFAINISAIVSDRLRVVAQPFWADGLEGTEADLDYAFAEWSFSKKLKLRAGKVQQPFGISTEVFDVGTLRPFLTLPQAVYGPIGMVGEAYAGVGLTGSFDLKGGWSLTYDVFGGGQHLEEFVPAEAVARGEEFETTNEIERTRDMVGGHLLVETPVTGLAIGASGYTGRELASGRRTGVGLQAEYLARPWSIRSEFAQETVQDDIKATGFYAEVAYHLDPHWQIAGQYDHLTSKLAGVPVMPVRTLLGHEEVAAGLNYWWNHDFVMKLSFHHVKGNRFAGPDPQDLADAFASGTLREKTNLVLFGAQFSF